MKAFDILDVKKFMAHLLIKETFDDFYIVSLKVKTFVETDIDGRLNPKWGEGEGQYAYWRMVRKLAYDIIKGNKSPDRIKLVLMSGEDVKNRLMSGNPDTEEADGIINICFEEDRLSITTGISMKTFEPAMSQNFGKNWDMAVEKFMDSNEIRFVDD